MPQPRGLAPVAAAIALLAGTAAAQTQEAETAQPEAGAGQSTSRQRVEIAGRQSATDLRRAASVAKQIYGRDELDKHGDTNTLDVMRRLPGVTVANGAPRLRGLGSGYTQILVNGDPAPQGFQLDQLSPSQVERIEVLRAPTADLSAQAIAGTINVVLKEAPRRSQRDLRIGLSSGLDRPQANANLNLGETRGPLALSLPLSAFEWRRENHNDIERRMPGTDGQPSAADQSGRQEVWGYGFNLAPRLQWKLSDEQDLGVQTFAQKGWWNNRTDHVNRVLAGSPVLDDDTQQDGTWQNLNGSLTWRNRFTDDQRIELRAGVRDSRWTFDVRNLRGGSVWLQAVGGGKQLTGSQAGKYSLLLGEAHSLTAGWDLEGSRRQEYRTVTQNGVPLLPDFEGQPFDARVRRQAFYAQDEWEISPQWQMYAGLRHEKIATESVGSNNPVRNESAVLSPLLHLTWKLDPKGRDMVRASLTRSYRAPNLGSLLARPSINGSYTDVSRTNTELIPDRIGNPTLRPELATGLDVAFEKYFPGGGLWSVGAFHRQIKDLVRNVTTLQPSVPWASAPRWVAQPQNFSAATTSGLEFEIRGRVTELLPDALGLPKNMNLRASVNLYRSRVEALPGPDNRLDGQQPWTANFGIDHRVAGLPLSLGGSLALNPAYDTQLTLDQTLQRSRTYALDLYGQWVFRPGLALRMSVNAGAQPFGPSNGSTRTQLANGDYTQIDRRTDPSVGLSLDVRL